MRLWLGLCKVSETKYSAPVCRLPQFSLLAHAETFGKAGILHRDISAGIIISVIVEGLLIDWDLSMDIEDLANISRQPFRIVSLTIEKFYGLCVMMSRCSPGRERGSLFQLGCCNRGQQYTPRLMTGSLFSMS